MLATQWTPDAQSKVWTFALRKGVKFHHGRELKASDVVFTFERILDPKTGSPGRNAMGPIEKVEAVDDYTVRFRMATPYADLPVSVGVTFGRIVPADRADKLATEPSGTGPFRVVEFKPASARGWCGSRTTGTSPAHTSTSCGRSTCRSRPPRSRPSAAATSR
jgi:peptide/nickel transport system substrate-binding protein